MKVVGHKKKSSVFYPNIFLDFRMVKIIAIRLNIYKYVFYLIV